MTGPRMKYMGSKRAMLRNGLGQLLRDEASNHQRFVDLFAGSGAVATHIATTTSLPVWAFDLQEYSTVVTGAIIARTSKLNAAAIWRDWLGTADKALKGEVVPPMEGRSPQEVADARRWSAAQTDWPITLAYGGHYFSPFQAMWIDALRRAVPVDPEIGRVCLASLIHAASQCAASPGHTAQPFQPSPSALPFLREAWCRNVVTKTVETLERLSGEHARTRGKALTKDANEAALDLKPGDLTFIDPPYSGVHYSRFYHVLETIAHGECGEVTGVGRYPSSQLRPRSEYSMRTSAGPALEKLLQRVAKAGSTAVLTFPDHECSNGLSGDLVREISRRYFTLSEQGVHSKFSTLGGHGASDARSTGRKARQTATELILVLRP